MNKRINLISITLFIYTCSFAQFSGKTEVTYSDPFQIDSSAYFLIPRLIDSDNREELGSGKGYLLWANYRDVHFYNSLTNQTKALFGKMPAIISSFNERRNYYNNEKVNEIPPNILAAHIVFLARTEDFNKDKGLDSQDPVYLFISSKTGDGLRQITPNGLHVISWVISKDKKYMLVKLMEDKNGNRKFGNGDDQVYYRIDLFEDISAIKTYPVPLPAN